MGASQPPQSVSTMTDRPPTDELDSDTRICAIVCAANGEYFVGSSAHAVRVWQAALDEKELATMPARGVNCLAVSQDNLWIAAGTMQGDVILWNAKTYDQVSMHKTNGITNGVDFSPDSTRLVVASDNCTASVWQVASCKQVLLTLRHENLVVAAKYSPQGHQIATATHKSSRVYDSDGHLLVDIPVNVTPWYNTGLVWRNDHLFVVSGSTIKKIETSTGSIISEWPVSTANYSSSIILSKHGEFIVYSANGTATLWDASDASHSQLGVLQHSEVIRSIALSSDDQFIAVGGQNGKSIKRLSRVVEPDTQIDDAVLDLWKKNQLAEVEVSLTTATPSHHALAWRALVRRRLQKWDEAIHDANESIEIQPSIIGYIAKSVALVSKGEKYDGYRECDIALVRFHSTHGTFISLIKAIIMFMAGEHDDAISYLDNIIATVDLNSACYVVKAYMYLELGNSRLENGNHEGAIRSFKRARTQMGRHITHPLLMVSLISGWRFSDLGITIRRHLCEALYAVGQTKEAIKVLLEIAETFGKKIYVSTPFANWLSDFTRRCLDSFKRGGDGRGNTQTPYTALRFTTATPLLRVWAMATLTSASWKDTLAAALSFTLPRFLIYCVVCGCLIMIGHIPDAVECFHQMEDELGQAIQRKEAKWILDFKCRCCVKLEDLGNTAMKARQHDEAIAKYSAALTLNPATPPSLSLHRKARAVAGIWGDVSIDPSELITLNPQSHFDHKRVLIKWAAVVLVNGSWKNALAIASVFKVARSTVYQALCEHLQTDDRIVEAIECLHEMETESGREMQSKNAKWVPDFRSHCRKKLEDLGDAAMNAQDYDEAISYYSAVLPLSPTPQSILIKRSKAYSARRMWDDALNDANAATKVMIHDPSSSWNYIMVLQEWAKVHVMDRSWTHALTAASDFKVPRIAMYEAICERLEMVNHIVELTECLDQMENELGQSIQGKGAEWILDLKRRRCGRLEDLGDSAMTARQYDKAILHYSIELPLSPTPQVVLIKRSKVYSAKGMWVDGINDANEAIALDPSSPSGYETKYIALSGAERHQEAIDVFGTMLLKMSQSLDPVIYERYRQYNKARETIRRAIQDSICELPRILINTTSGRLCDKYEQAAAFELLPDFTELILSATTHIDHARIEREVKEYYRYATFSHRWEVNEPLFEKVINTIVYDLEDSPTHDKLKTFCTIVRDAGFHWAWSDTCCINKTDHFVLQEALVAMFEWFRGSSLTIIFLRGVHFPSIRGDLIKSIWNTRAWTLQEYHASKVVRFYTEDWTPYLDLDIPNHKESPEIISEMEEATGVSAQALMGLQPGIDDIREKLCLASGRKTTFVEDAAYSLLGIFSTSLPVVYGEKDRALGRLLAQLLTSSGDVSILAWTGKSGSFNSCLPASVTVFSQLATSHIPQAIEVDALDVIAARIRASPLNPTLVMRLYDRLNELPVPMFIGQRMKLPCITFKLGPLSTSRTRSGHVFRAKTDALGVVEIQTTENLSRLDSLTLVHPWIDFLLDRQPVGSVAAEENTNDRVFSIGEPPSVPCPSDAVLEAKQTRTLRFISRFGKPFGMRRRDAVSLLSPMPISLMDKRTQALRLIARLRQPFSALLITPTRHNVEEYRRVAAESLITVQVKEDMPLDVLIGNTRMLDVL